MRESVSGLLLLAYVSSGCVVTAKDSSSSCRNHMLATLAEQFSTESGEVKLVAQFASRQHNSVASGGAHWHAPLQYLFPGF